MNLRLFYLPGMILSAASLVGCSHLHTTKGQSTTGARVFDVAKYGAVNDGKTDSTTAFQAAITACKNAGGGTVFASGGSYAVGSLDFVSNMTLKLQDTTLLFSQNPDQYPVVETRFEGVMTQGRRPLLWAKDCHDIAIIGNGTLDGQGLPWWNNIHKFGDRNSSTTAESEESRKAAAGAEKRPPLFQTRDCTGVTVDGITFKDSPFWTTHFLFTDNITIRNCRMVAPESSHNTDACDLDSCRHVLIENCFASDGDDAFTLKSGRDADGRRVNRPTEDVTIRHCQVEHAHGAVVIGSETAGSVRHVHFYDIDANGTDAGLRIKSMRGRGGVVEDIVAEDIRCKNVKQAFIITMNYGKSDPAPKSESTPVFHDIHVKNLSAENSVDTGIIAGISEQPIMDITFENLNLNGKKPMKIDDAQNITFKNVTIATDTLPCLLQNNAVDIHITDWHESKRDGAK